MKLIKNISLVLPDQVLKRSGILFSNRIERILKEEELKAVEEKPDLEVIDGRGLYLSPGFIDIHIHGAAGHDTMDSTYEAINMISKAVIKSGVTSFLPTTMTMPMKSINKTLKNIREVISRGTSGARPLGVHLEGPFINPEYKGAQNDENIVSPDISLIENYLDVIKIVTIAPELEGAKELAKSLTQGGIVVSAGHTGATYEKILEARRWGVNHITHLFNAMTGLHHRQPGAVGAALTLDMTCEIIADFIHLHSVVIELVLKIKDPAEVILITDQMMAGSLGEGVYQLGGQKVFVKNGEARLENGQLAGSILTLDQAIRNINKLKVLSLPRLFNLVTYNPARLLGLENEIGQIAPGCRADLVLMDEEFRVKNVYIDGREVVKEGEFNEGNH